MPSFTQDIKPLFRESDRDEMASYFDLWDYDEVREHAEDIIARLETGDMPCDAPWSEDRIEQFRRWVREGLLR